MDDMDLPPMDDDDDDEEGLDDTDNGTNDHHDGWGIMSCDRRFANYH